MANPLTFRSSNRSSTFRDSDGDTLRGTGIPEEEEAVTTGLFAAGLIPLVVRLSTARADRVITRDVRSLSFRSTIPGGFASCELQLDRPLSLMPDEIAMYGSLYVYDGRSGAVIWQGRMEDPGRGASGEGEGWTVRAVGPAAHARDRAIKLIYIDKSLERWGLVGRSFAAPNEKGGELQDMEDPSDDPGFTLRAQRGVICGSDWRFGQAYRELNDAGQDLGRIRAKWDAGQTAANWYVQAKARTGIAGAADDADEATFNVAGGTLIGVVTTDFTAGRDVIELRIQRKTSGITVADEDTWAEFSGITVVARRYDKSGALITSYPNNYVLASSVVEDLLGRLLNQYDGANAIVDATISEIEQLAYPDGVTSEKVLEDLMAIESDFYWAAWEGNPARFEWQEWPSTVRYEASTKDGFDSPASAVELYNRVTVRWRGEKGRLRSTVRTATVSELDDAGLIRQAIIDLGDEIGSLVSAQAAGDAFLVEHGTVPNAGTLHVASQIFDADEGRYVDPWEIRPGHLIRVRDVLPRFDSLNTAVRDAVTVFRIVAVSYDADSNIAQIELDSRPRTIESMFAATNKKLEKLRKR